MLLQEFVHYFLHIVAPAGIAYLYGKKHWLKYWLILLATMLVDLDHLWATPMFDAERCSIGFHPLHTEIAITVYLLGMIFVKHKIIRLICIGLFFHMLTDFVDCIWIFSRCAPCLQDIF